MSKDVFGTTDQLEKQRFYYGTRAELKPGDLIDPDYPPNDAASDRTTTYVYLTPSLDAAIWEAELATGERPGRVYIVEPIGQIVDASEMTDKQSPGHPWASYCSREPLRVMGEVTDWQGHSPEKIQAMKDRIKGLEPIDD